MQRKCYDDSVREETFMKEKRFLTAVLAMLLITGCGTRPADPAAAEPEQEKEQETAAEPEPEPLFERGTVDGQSYVNSFFGIKVEFSNDWVVSDDDNIATISQQTQETLSDENAKEKIEEGSAVLDMFAQSPRTGETVNLFMEDLGTTGANAEMLIAANISAVTRELEEQKFENVTVQRGTAVFLGEEVPCMEISALYAGLDFFERQVYIIKGRNIASVTAASFNEDTTQNTLDLFTKN